MKRGKDEEKSMGPMFPRLHVNDTEKGGPRAPPRNKMALYEQLSIPSQRFNPNSTPLGSMNEKGSFFPVQPMKQTDTRHSDFKNQVVQQEHKKRQEEDDFRVPIFDQQSGTSKNRSGIHQNRENEGITPFGATLLGRLANGQNTKVQKEKSQEFAKSASNQSTRQNNKVPLKETNGSSSFDQRNGNLRDYRVDSQADKTLWGESVLNEAIKGIGHGHTSVPVREVQQEALTSPTNGDAVSETSMVDSVCGVDISPDDVVELIGQKHFWKARRAIVNQQRAFAVQVFELHRLIKVQRLIAGSPHHLGEDNTYLAKPPKVSPIKKIPIEYVLKSTPTVPNHKDDMEFSAENAVGKASPSSVQNGSQTTKNPVPPSEPKMASWSYNQVPGHQWLIPVMSPSEGLVYKPYPGPGFMSPPVYGGHNSFANYGVPPSEHHYDLTGLYPASHGYFPPYGMPPTSRTEQMQHQSSSNVPMDTNEAPAHPSSHGYFPPYNTPRAKQMQHQSSSNVPNGNVQASTASSQRGGKALPLPPPEPSRVIRVVPHNARSATASVARIFQSIQEERKQHDSG